jgi:hypothetical protein
MKKINIIKLVFLAAVGILLPNACTKNYEELNTNPKLITADLVDIGLILTYVEEQAVVENADYGNGSYGCFCGMDKRGDDNPFTEQDAPGIWNFAYETAINNLSNIIQLIESNANKADLVNKQAIARILKVWAVSKLTDTYGDVPYSESCLPQDQAVTQPKYDTQQSIYTDLFKELKEAAAQLDDSKASYGSADLIYNGDVAKWRKLANSLRLRLALRIRFADQAQATTQLSDLTEDGLLSTLAEDAYIKNNTDYTSHLNPRYYRIINYKTVSEEVVVHQVLMNILKNDSLHMDPRIQIFADTVMASFKGGISPNGYYFPYYLYRGSPTLGNCDVEYKYPWGSGTTSLISDLWRVPVVAPAIMKYSEVYFALAEAKLAGLLPAAFSGSANDYYQKGIDAGIAWAQWFYNLVAPQIPALMKDWVHNPAYAPGNQWTDADVNNYLDYKKIKDATIANFKEGPSYNLSGTAEQQMEMIINQKLVALYPDEFQGWCEYRRTGYPKVALPTTGVDKSALNGTVPRRESWPTAEETINSKSYEDALARYGTDKRLTKFWWDANPAAPHEYVWTMPTMPSAYQ